MLEKWQYTHQKPDNGLTLLVSQHHLICCNPYVYSLLFLYVSIQVHVLCDFEQYLLDKIL